MSCCDMALLDVSRWMELHRREVNREYAGKWVAVSSRGVVASASTISGLKLKVAPNELPQLLLTRIPLPKEVGILVVCA